MFCMMVNASPSQDEINSPFDMCSHGEKTQCNLKQQNSFETGSDERSWTKSVSSWILQLWTSDFTSVLKIWKHNLHVLFCHQVLALTSLTQVLAMLKSVGFFPFNSLVSAIVTYSSISKDFLVLSPSDLLRHTRKLNSSDLFNLHWFVNTLCSRTWKAQINKSREHINRKSTTYHTS